MSIHSLLFIFLAVPGFSQLTHLKKVQDCLLNSDCSSLIVAAHRQGYQGTFENSLWAFHQHLGKDTDALELDLRETRDGALILMHDEKVDRTTDGKGKVSGMTLAQIQRLKIKGLSEYPPTFEQIAYLAQGQFFLVIDVKSASVRKVWEAIKRGGLERQAIIFVDKNREYYEINKLLAQGEDPLFMPRLRESMSAAQLMDFFFKNPRFVHIDMETLNPTNLDAIRQRGAHAYMHFPSLAATSELRQAGLELLKQGVHFFDHDNVNKVYEALAERRVGAGSR